jgi:glycosyltransferase involved in cell wall biosynthesis
LYHQKDVEALAKALIKIASNRKLRKQMGQAGRNRVSEMFTIERMKD